jgi:hypothetical protein
MALIKCPDCEQQVSSSAAICIHCGGPLSRALDPKAVITTQQTSKRYKALQLVGVGMTILGLVLFSGENDDVAGYTFVTGIGLWIGAKVRAWWDHG